MSKKPCTHVGEVQSPYGNPNVVHLRETPCFWITEGGRKYRKSDEGSGHRLYAQGDASFRRSFLNVTTIRRITIGELRKPLAETVDNARHCVRQYETQLELAKSDLKTAEKNLQAFNDRHAGCSDGEWPESGFAL